MKIVLNISWFFFLLLFIYVKSFGQDREKTIDVCFPQNFLINKTYTNSVITLKILLVEFADIKHRTIPSAYTRKDFENLFFSENVYVSPNMYSPDGKEIWGSLRDYYSVMSNGELEIHGKIVNNSYSEGNNELQWITLSNNKSYYHNYRGGEFRSEAKIKAQNLGFDITTNDSSFLVIVYAGHTYRAPAGEAANTLNPQAFFSHHEYIMGERFASYSPYESERPDAHFAHIGIHAHEFAHLLGLPDLNNKKFDLMSGGEYNGPDLNCACPAPINPFHRKLLGWLNYIDVLSDSIIQPTYNLQNSQLFKIKDSNIGANYFIIEYRKFDGLMNLGGNVTSDYNSYIYKLTIESGILVWRVFFNSVVGLIYADGNNDDNYDGHVFPGNRNVKVISPWSDSRIPYDGHLWYPNTKPSLNCGMEIISEIQGNYTIKLYSLNPLNSSPSKPRGLNADINISGEVVLNWEPNFETDIINKGTYNIYKSESIDTLPTAFKYAATITAYQNGNSVTSWTDTKPESGVSNNLFYRITAIDNENKESVPSDYVWVAGVSQVYYRNDSSRENEKIYLLNNYPNPFNPTTTIGFLIPASEFISLIVYDVLGNEVASLINEEKPAGAYEVKFNADRLSSGIYFYKIEAGEFIQTKKMTFLR